MIGLVTEKILEMIFISFPFLLGIIALMPKRNTDGLLGRVPEKSDSLLSIIC